MRHLLLALCGCGLLALSNPAAAQSNPPSSQAIKKPGDCKQASTAEPATKPAQGSADGTAPGNSGSTGWSGGTGGSYIGTNPSGSSSSSKSFQPATARGLDPIDHPITPTQASC